MDEKELFHHGVKGMRWGVRKSPDEIKRQRRDSKADNDDDEEHEDYKKTVARKSMKSMSTKEIQEINTRIQAENQFRELNKTGFDKFKDRVKSIAANIAEEQAKKFVNHYADAGREKVQGFIDEKTGLGTLLGLDTKSEENRKAFNVKLKETRERWENAFGKKKEKPKVETPKKEESEAQDNTQEKKNDERTKDLAKFLNSKGSFEMKGKKDGESKPLDIPNLNKTKTEAETKSKRTATEKMIAIAKKKKKK